MPSQKSKPTPTPDFISLQVTESDYFFLDLKPSAERGFSVTCGGLEYCDKNYHIDRSHFDYFGMEYVVSGTCSLVLDGRTHQLKAGSIFCYGPSTHHQIHNTGAGPLIKFFVDFSGADVAKVIGDPFLKGPLPYQMCNLRNMHGVFRQIQEIGKQGGPGCQRILRQMLELVAMLARFKAVDLEQADSRSYTTYAHCLTHIQNHFTGISSIEELARTCNVSTGHLSRVFKKYSGESPWQMVTRLKMNHAGELILRDRLMIKEVAARIGFEDAYHFSRVFKQYYGISPKHFGESVRT